MSELTIKRVMDEDFSQDDVIALFNENAALRARIVELEHALRLHLAVSPDDPLLIEPVEQELVRLRAKVEELEKEKYALKRSVGLDCGDNSCKYALEIKGMRTNGRCRCDPKRMKEDLERARAIADQAQAALAACEQERDLAIAHDRQPYPTAWAYEQACKALESTKQQLAQAQERVRELERESYGEHL